MSIIVTWIKNIFTKKPSQQEVEFANLYGTHVQQQPAIIQAQSKLVGRFTMPDPFVFVRNELGGTIRRIIVTQPLRPTDLMRSDDPLSPLIPWTSTSTDRTEYEVEGSWYSEEEYQRLLKMKAFL